MAYSFCSSTGLPVQVSAAYVLDTDGSTLYTLSGIDCFGDFQLIVDYIRLNLGDLSYKSGGQLVDLLRYRLATGTNDLTQDMAHGRKIIFA